MTFTLQVFSGATLASFGAKAPPSAAFRNFSTSPTDTAKLSP